MKRSHVLCNAAALVFLGIGSGWGQTIAAPRDGPGVEEGVEVLTRGPVHEAFAGTVSFNPEPGIVTLKAPPAAIEELPPEQRAEGTNVAWIPGYWAWDDERNDFLWVSGIWRDLPPGRQWVPGYWGQAAQGSQWTSGYWADAQASEIVYLPEPPQSVENGPNIEAPSADQTWLPGCWIWQQSRYAWRPGYWAAAQPDWVWVPAYYAWAPRGYVFVDGYYDYSVARRGVLFAPVHFQASVYSRQGFSYSPATVINPAVFASHLFLRPNYQHYYFGDYYAASYSQAGYYPGYSIHSSRRGYDPIYAHQHWQHRNDRDWDRGVQANFQRLREDENARPPRTWAAQAKTAPGAAGPNTKGFVVAAALDQLSKSKDSPLRFQPVDQAERQQLAKRGQEIQRFGQERQKLESQAARTSAETRVQATEPARIKFPRSPLLGKPTAALAKDQAPLKTPEAPKPDLTIEPKPRTRSPEQPRTQSANRLPLDTERSLPSAAPRGDQPKTQPQPPLPQVDRTPSQPQSKLPVQPRTQPPLQPKVETPATAPKRQAEQPAPKAQAVQPAPIRQAEQPAPKRQAEQPAPKPQAVQPPPKPQTAPKPQPRVEQPAPKPQPQPRVEQPRPQPQAKPQPQPQPRVEQPKPQPQVQPKGPAAPPQGKPAAPGQGKSDKPKGKG